MSSVMYHLYEDDKETGERTYYMTTRYTPNTELGYLDDMCTVFPVSDVSIGFATTDKKEAEAWAYLFNLDVETVWME